MVILHTRMGKFAEELKRQIKAAKTTQTAMADKSGIEQTTISDLVTGNRASVKPEQVWELARALGPESRMPLFLAHLEDIRDKLVGLDNQEITITAGEPDFTLKEASATYGKTDLEQAVTIMYEQARENPHLEASFIRMAKFLRPEPPAPVKNLKKIRRSN